MDLILGIPTYYFFDMSKGISDTMTFVHVTELEYNFVLDKISMVIY